jgi:hypothetical protein
MRRLAMIAGSAMQPRVHSSGCIGTDVCAMAKVPSTVDAGLRRERNDKEREVLAFAI